MGVPILVPMTVEDVDEVVQLERRCFRQPWSRHMFLMDLTTNNIAMYLVLKPAPEDAQHLPPILAYGGSWLIVGEAHIATIASHPDWRGCGLGHRMLLALIDANFARGAERSTLEVRTTNHVARTLYEQVGYRWVGTRRAYYQDGEDALVMTTPPLADPPMPELLAQQHAAAVAHLEHCFAAHEG